MPIIITANPKITPDIGNRVFALLEFLSIMDVTRDSASIHLSLSLSLFLVVFLSHAFPRIDRPILSEEERSFSSSSAGRIKITGPGSGTNSLPLAFPPSLPPSPLVKIRVHHTVNY